MLCKSFPIIGSCPIGSLLFLLRTMSRRLLARPFRRDICSSGKAPYDHHISSSNQWPSETLYQGNCRKLVSLGFRTLRQLGPICTAIQKCIQRLSTLHNRNECICLGSLFWTTRNYYRPHPNGADGWQDFQNTTKSAQLLRFVLSIWNATKMQGDESCSTALQAEIQCPIMRSDAFSLKPALYVDRPHSCRHLLQTKWLLKHTPDYFYAPLDTNMSSSRHLTP